MRPLSWLKSVITQKQIDVNRFSLINRLCVDGKGGPPRDGCASEKMASVFQLPQLWEKEESFITRETAQRDFIQITASKSITVPVSLVLGPSRRYREMPQSKGSDRFAARGVSILPVAEKWGRTVGGRYIPTAKWPLPSGTVLGRVPAACASVSDAKYQLRANVTVDLDDCPSQ